MSWLFASGGQNMHAASVSSLGQRQHPQKYGSWDFPVGPVVKTSPSNARGVGSTPAWRAKIPPAAWPKHRNIKQKQCCDRFNKDKKKQYENKQQPQQNNLGMDLVTWPT